MNNAYNPFIPLSIHYGANPNAGDPFKLTIPDNEIWMPISARFSLSTSGAPVNRHAFLLFRDPADFILMATPYSNAMAEGLTWHIYISTYPDKYFEAGTTNIIIPWPSQFQAPGLFNLEIQIFAMEPDDQIYDVAITHYKIPFDMS